jgi:CBS domain-containing protein
VKRVASLVENREVYSITPSLTVTEAAAYMAERKIGAVAVVSDQGLVGLFSERDVLKRVIAAERDPKTTRVAEVMSTALLTADAEEGSQACLDRMAQAGFRHLPVLRNGRLLGLITMRDLMLAHLEETDGELGTMRAFMEFSAPAG